MTDEEYRQRYAAWTAKGAEAYHSTRRHLFTLFGGGKGGSKTVTGCRIIQTDISNHRDGLFVVMRRNYTVLHDTTKRTFDRFFPAELIERKTADVWYCTGNNQILWWAADSSTDPEYEKTRGLEASAIFIDEGSEFDEAFYELAPSLLRRPAYHRDTGAPLRGYIYLTTNPVPGRNWLKRHFIDPKTRKHDGQHHFIQSLPDDNPLLPEGYIDTAFSTMSGAMLRMLRFGDWDIEEVEFAIIPRDALDAATINLIVDRNPVAAGIDIGLGRPDVTVVWCVNAAGEFWCELEITEYDTMVQVQLLSDVVERVKANRGKVAVDAGSIGKGVSDELLRLYGWVIIPVLFGESADDEPLVPGKPTQQYENRRAQIYYWARLDVISGDVLIEMTEQLREDLDNTYFEPNPANQKIKLEPKSQIKSRLGRSPDDGDSFALANLARRKTCGMKLTLPSRGLPVMGTASSAATTRSRSSIDFTGFR